MCMDFNSLETFQSELFESRKRFLNTGDFIGESQNYRLLRLLGEGGMGQAWLAEEIENGKVLRLTVCKILPAEVQKDPREMRKVETVFNLTKTLNHTNICPLYGMKFDSHLGWFLVMGYAEGISLRKWLLEQPEAEMGLPLEKVLNILKPLASALDYAHRKRVIHRDIKPENVMFSANDSDLWIIDFGIAAQIHETCTRTCAASGTSGTPYYMAPEQFLGEPQDAKTDLYALGVMAYELLSGATPFSGNVYAISHQILNVAPKFLPNVSRNVNLALQCALAKRPEDRFSTCGEFVEALEATPYGVKLPNTFFSVRQTMPPAASYGQSMVGRQPIRHFQDTGREEAVSSFKAPSSIPGRPSAINFPERAVFTRPQTAESPASAFFEEAEPEKKQIPKWLKTVGMIFWGYWTWCFITLAMGGAFQILDGFWIVDILLGSMAGAGTMFVSISLLCRLEKIQMEQCRYAKFECGITFIGILVVGILTMLITGNGEEAAKILVTTNLITTIWALRHHRKIRRQLAD